MATGRKTSRVTTTVTSEECRLNKEQWLKLTFGKYRGMSLPSVILHDPGWFYWALAQPGLFVGRMLAQAKFVADRAGHIRPSVSEKKCVAAFSLDPRQGISRIWAAEDESRLPKNAVSLPHLNLGIVQEFNRETQSEVTERLLSFLGEQYFDGEGHHCRQSQCEGFFERDRNFSPKCSERHFLRTSRQWKQASDTLGKIQWLNNPQRSR